MKDPALIDMDPADLSEIGRERRRQALEELREAQRRTDANSTPLRFPLSRAIAAASRQDRQSR
jgi:hypothetical protein